VTRLRRFFCLTGAAAAVLCALLVWADAEGRRWRGDELPQLRHMVSRLGLTDLALWTEARYARHPSQTDRFSAFQDFPASPEHFPAGSIVPPPPVLGPPAGADGSP
jgi:hypothetical protein